MKNKQRKARSIMSFNLDLDVIDKLEKMARSDGLNRSEWVNRLIWAEQAGRMVQEDLKSGIQTRLEVHTHDAEHRSRRADGKCNPKSMKGECATCWPNYDVVDVIDQRTSKYLDLGGRVHKELI